MDLVVLPPEYEYIRHAVLWSIFSGLKVFETHRAGLKYCAAHGIAATSRRGRRRFVGLDTFTNVDPLPHAHPCFRSVNSWCPRPVRIPYSSWHLQQLTRQTAGARAGICCSRPHRSSSSGGVPGTRTARASCACRRPRCRREPAAAAAAGATHRVTRGPTSQRAQLQAHALAIAHDAVREQDLYTRRRNLLRSLVRICDCN